MTDLPSRYVHQTQKHLMRLFGAGLAVLLATAAMAQTSSAEDCEKYFSDLRWTLVEPNSFWQLASDHAGAVLVGKTCDADFIKSWFSTAGWRLDLDQQSEAQEFGPTEGRFWQDRYLDFCLPREWPWRWRTQGCSVVVGVTMFQGRITRIGVGAPI